MSNYQVSIEKDEMELVVDVVVTSFVSVKPNSSTWDSDWDYYGYEELEFDVESVVGFDYETENETTLTEDVLTNKDYEYIEERVFGMMKEEY